MENMLAEYDNPCEGSLWQREVTVKLDDRSYIGNIDSISREGALISMHDSFHQYKGKTIYLLMQCQDLKTVKTAKIVWSDEWGFGVKFI